MFVQRLQAYNMVAVLSSVVSYFVSVLGFHSCVEPFVYGKIFALRILYLLLFLFCLVDWYINAQATFQPVPTT